ncbi:hypothetical protein V8C34DRAFT_18820 [Trichoderma compactum]
MAAAPKSSQGPLDAEPVCFYLALDAGGNAEGYLFRQANVCVFAHGRYYDCDISDFSRLDLYRGCGFCQMMNLLAFMITMLMPPPA